MELTLFDIFPDLVVAMNGTVLNYNTTGTVVDWYVLCYQLMRWYQYCSPGSLGGFLGIPCAI